MKERPILFSGPMVRALLAGSKTQTRRIVKPKIVPVVEECFRVNGKWCNYTFDYDMVGLCPHGAPGDRLWVKETSFDTNTDPTNPRFAAAPRYIYRADFDYREKQRRIIGVNHWKPSIFCARAASRITLELTAVRVERLNEISAADAMAEGIIKQTVTAGRAAGRPDYDMFALRPGDHCEWECTAQEVYRQLWESINGPGSWAANPWVWVIEFKRME